MSAVRVRRWLPWLALGLVVAVVLVVAATDDEPASDADRVRSLSRRLACPVCEGESVADSQSTLSAQIRNDLAARVATGQSDDEILAAYADQYGDDILLRPPAEGIGLLVWALPVAAVLGGGVVLALCLRRWRREPSLSATPADVVLVERERVAAPGAEVDPALPSAGPAAGPSAGDGTAGGGA